MLTPSNSPSEPTNSVANSVLSFLNKLVPQTRDDIVKGLSEFGFNGLGSGDFATVYGRPDLDFVVKVGGYSNQYKKPDSWPKYAKLVMAQFEHNPYAPKITALREFNDNFYYSVMEHLEPEPMSGDDLFCKMSEELERWGGLSTHNFSESHPELHDLLVGIKSLHEVMDLHSENAMYRKDGQLVITDPIY